MNACKYFSRLTVLFLFVFSLTLGVNHAHATIFLKDTATGLTTYFSTTTTPYTPNIALTANSTLSQDDATQYSLSGVISGAFGLTFGSTLKPTTISNANTYSGGATISSSTVIVSNTQALGSGTTTLLNNSILGINNTISISNNIIINSGSVATVTMNYNGGTNFQNLNGVLYGSGTLNINSNFSSSTAGNLLNGITNLFTSNFNGNINIYTNSDHFFPTFSNTATVNGSTISVSVLGSLGATSTNLQQSFLYSAYSGNQLIQFGSLSGDGTISGTQLTSSSTTYEIGALSTNTTFSGTIRDNLSFGPGFTAINKVGTGLLVLSGANYYTGTTTINQGELRMNGISYAPSTLGCANCILKTSPSTINIVGGKLSGTGTVGPVIVSNTASSTIQGGTGAGNAGTLTVSSLNSAGTNARLLVNTDGITASRITSNGSVSITGLTVDLGGNIPNGSYTIISGSSITGVPVIGSTSTLSLGKVVSISTTTNSIILNIVNTLAPAAPSGVIASAVSTSSLLLSWNTVASSTGYQISSSPNSGNLTTSTTTTSNSFLVTGLSSSTLYTFNIASFNINGTSSVSSISTSTILNASVISPNNTNIYYSPYNWYKGSTTTVTNSAGAYLKTVFTGRNFVMKINPSSAIVSKWPKIGYVIDGFTGSTSTPYISGYSSTTNTIDINNLSDKTTINFTPTPLSNATHTIQIWVDAIGNTDRWTPKDFLEITGFQIDLGASLSQPIIKPNRILQYGDSITEGWGTLNGGNMSGNTNTDNQYVNTWSFQEANMLNAEIGIRAFAGQGYGVAAIIPGVVSGTYLTGTSSWNYVASGLPINFVQDKAPDLIINNHGSNDGVGLATSTILQFVNNIRSLNTISSTTPIVLLSPLTTGNAGMDPIILNGYKTSNSDRNVYYANPGATSGSPLHPYFTATSTLGSDLESVTANNAVNVLRQIITPATPNALTLTPAKNSIQLNWSIVNSTTSQGSQKLPPTLFNIYRNNILVGTTTSNSYIDSGLNSLTSYSYYVTAGSRFYSTLGLASASSSQVSASTVSYDKISISPQTVNISTSTATISWTTTSTSTDTFLYSLNNINYVNATVTNKSISLKGLAPGVVYFYKINSIDNNTGYASTYTNYFRTSLPVISKVSTTKTSSVEATSTLISLPSQVSTTSISFATTTSTTKDSVTLKVPAQAIGTSSVATINNNLNSTITASSTADTSFQIEKLSETFFSDVQNTTGLKAVSNKVYRIEAVQVISDITATDTIATQIKTFSKPLRVTISYDSGDISSIKESTLTIRRYDSGIGWSILTNCSIDYDLKTVSCDTDHLSDFALMGDENPTTTQVQNNGIILFTPQSNIKNNAVSTTSNNIQKYSIPKTFKFNKDLKFGQKNNDVLYLQYFLFNNNYLNDSPTGYFGLKTVEALKKYQKDIGFAKNLQTGLFYSKTRGEINKTFKK